MREKILIPEMQDTFLHRLHTYIPIFSILFMHFDGVGPSNSVWIADSGASCHMVNDDSFLCNIRQTANNFVKVGNGKCFCKSINFSRRIWKFVYSNCYTKLFLTCPEWIA